MNKMMKSAIAIGAGITAYHLLRKNDVMSRKNMRRMKKMITKAMP